MHRRPSYATSAGNQSLLTFLPRCLVHQAYRKELPDSHHVETFQAAVLFADISGFTALTERLSGMGPAGFEVLCKALNNYFDTLISVIDEYGGDVIKIAGDALLVVWMVSPINELSSFSEPGDPFPIPRHSSIPQNHFFSHNPAHAVYRAACCATKLLERHDTYKISQNAQLSRLESSGLTEMLTGTPISSSNPRQNLRLHCSLTFGSLFGVHCETTTKRHDFLISDEEIFKRISHLSSISNSGDIMMDLDTLGVLQSFCHADPTVLEIQPVPDHPDVYKLIKLREQTRAKSKPKRRMTIFRAQSSKHEIAFNSLDLSAQPGVDRLDSLPGKSEFQEWLGMCPLTLPMFERLTTYIPAMVHKRICTDHMDYIADIRKCCVAFISFEIQNISTPSRCGLINDAYQIVQDTADKSEGFLRQFLMDDKGFVAILIYGLTGMSHEDDSTRCLDSALKVYQSLTAIGMTCAIGCTSGNAFCGIIGGTSRREFAVVGDVVNFAARLMCLKNGIICDEVLYTQNKHHMKFNILEPTKIKGKESPMPLYQPLPNQRFVDDVSTEANEQDSANKPRLTKRSSVRDRQFVLNLVGRKAEMDLATKLLLDFKQQSRLKQTDIVKPRNILVVTGDAGLGKSAMMSFVKSFAVRQGYNFYVSVASPLDSATPYFVWRDIFKRLLGLDKLHEMEQRTQVVQDLISLPNVGKGNDDGIEIIQEDSQIFQPQMACLLNEILDIHMPENGMISRMPVAKKAQLRRDILLHLFNLEKHPYPRIVIIEDAQWMDSASWQFLIYAGKYSSNTFFALTTRPMALEQMSQEMTQFSTLEKQTVTMPLNPINRADCIQLATSILKVGNIPHSVANIFYDKTQGNPFFVEEICYALLEKGAVVMEDKKLKFSPTFDLSAIKLPETIRDMIVQRIDLLDFDAMITLKTASVFGQTFSIEELSHVYPNPARRSLIPKFLETCKQQKLIAQSSSFQTTYSFPSVTIRDIAYELLLISQRHRLHLAVAEYYEEKYATSIARYYPLLAYHFSRANARAKAIEYYNKSADQAVLTKCSQEVIKYLTEVYEIAAGDGNELTSHQKMQWAYLLGEAYFNCGMGKIAIMHYSTCLDESGLNLPESKWMIKYEVGKQNLEASFENQIGGISTALRCRHSDVVPLDEGPFTSGVGMLRDTSVPLFQRSEGVRREDRSQIPRSSTWTGSRFTQSTSNSEEDLTEHKNRVLVCLSRLSHLYTIEGQTDLAYLCSFIMISLAQDSRVETDCIQSLGNLSLLYASAHKNSLARNYIQKLRISIATQDIYGNTCIRAAVSLLNASLSLLSMGDVDFALRYSEAGLSYAVLVNDPRTQMEFHVYSSYIHFVRDGVKATEEICQRIHRIAQSKSDVQIFCAYAILQGLLFARSPPESSIEVMSSLEDSMIYIESLGRNALTLDRVLLRSIYALIHHRMDILTETISVLLECKGVHILFFPAMCACLCLALRHYNGGRPTLRHERNLSVVEQMMDDKRLRPSLVDYGESGPSKAEVWNMVKILMKAMSRFAKLYPILLPCVYRYQAYVYLCQKSMRKTETALLSAYRRAKELGQKMEMCLSSLELMRNFPLYRSAERPSDVVTWDSLMYELHLSERIPGLERKLVPF
eukprot:TRINITY_DN9_c1_g1_i1.p1 TRINITY_DN9_c1_g1~~TRINITY_DN9_c1_g1_i1.p1  ORF type:complete len:1624 (-),score=269.95 TRINITY_DN9_c1_g1_i1:326-5197(-)